MPVNKVRGRGSYAPLSAHAYKDDALAEAGEAAELLFYRGLSFAADVINDGYISDSQLTRLPGWGMKDVHKRARRLAEVGLWVREDGGYRIKSWLKWNRSRAEIERLQKKDADRHVKEPEVPDGEGLVGDSDSERIPNGVHVESESDMLALDGGFHTPKPTPEPEPDTTPEPKGSGRKRPAIKLPASWSPTESHRELAKERKVDLQREVFRFRNHAEANDRRQASWNAAFTTWLDRAADFAKPAAAGNLRPWVEQ